MAFVYVVRCNFNEPAKEQAWNDWYSGPKIAQILAKPHFRSCQRFTRSSGSGRNYLALWTLQSPDAFKTPQYTTDWGFFEWAPHITDWSRDLFDGGKVAERSFAVPPQGGLHIVSFDGASPDEAAAARGAVSTSQPDMMWLPVVGLDRHTPIMGMRVLRDSLPRQLFQGGESLQDRLGCWQEATYRPISEFATAD